MQPTPLLTRQLWRWYLLLVIANELDLVYTSIAIVAVLRWPIRRRQRVLTVLQAVTAVYAVLALMHVVNLLAALWRG